MTILTVVTGASRDEVVAQRPADRPGFKRSESLEDYTLPLTKQCGKCGAEHIDQTRVQTQWRLSVIDTKG